MDYTFTYKKCQYNQKNSDCNYSIIFLYYSKKTPRKVEKILFLMSFMM